MRVIGFAVAIYGAVTGNAWATRAGVALMTAGSYLDARKARRRARDAYNASLKDRLEMVDVQPDAARTLVLGRVRAVEGIRRRWSSGTNAEKLTLVVSFAGHEIDAFEAFYADDIELTLDGSGYVQTEPYRKTSHVSLVEQGVLDGAGAASVTLSGEPIAGTVTAIYRDGAGDTGNLTVGGSGTSVTLSGGPAAAEYWVNYQSAQGASMMRIRPYLGAAGQNVGADLAADYPGKISSADKFADIALAVVDLEYDPDVYPQGVPRITARMRGAKVLDPRTSTTAWSENPALLAYHYARHANGWAVPVDEIRTADIEAAADVCDVSTDFTLRKSPTVTETVTLPRYRCGIVIPTDGDPRAAMDDIFETMAGRWGWAGGTWRMRAGHMATPVWDMQPNWVAQRLGPDGLPADGGAVVQWSSGVPRENKVNRVTGRCVDPDQRWQVLPFPAVQDAVLIAAEGQEYALEVELQGVNHVAHAQHLATVRIRQAQASLRGDVQCNLTAYPVELFDVGEVTLPRYGMAAKTFECVGWRWHPAEGVRLALEEITAEIYTPVAELTGRDPAPNSSLPAPWDVETVTGVVVTSGTVPLTDASVLTRTQVAWDAVVSEAVRVGGHIEVQYLQADATLPDGDWPSWQEQGSATVAVIPGLLAEAWYIFRVRAVSALGVRGAWSAQVRHQVAAPPAVAGVQLLALQATGFAYVFATTADTTSTSPAIVFTAELINVTGTVTFSGTAYDSAGAVVGVAGDVTFTSVTATSATLTVANFTRGGTTVRYVKVTATLGSLSDTTTVYRGDGGADAIQARLTNEAHTLPAQADGTVISYTGASGTMQVYKGTTLLSNVTTPSVSFALAPSGNPQALTYSINATSGAYSVTAMGAGVDVATLTIRATLSTGETRDAVFSLGKSKQGAQGADGAAVTAYSDNGSVFISASSGTSWTPASIQLKRFLSTGLTGGTTSWSVVSGTFTGSLSMLSETDGRMATFTPAQMTTDAVAFRCTYTVGASTYTDDITVTKSRDGFGAYLTNDAVSLPADASGNITSYTGATGTFKVTNAAGDISTAALAFSITGHSGFGTTYPTNTGISITSAGVYTISSNIPAGTTVATVTFRATYTDPLGGTKTFDRVFTLSKSTQGATGGTGNTGQSNHRVYKAVTIGSPPATPGTTTSGATPAGWSATPLTLTTGQEQYQSDGTTPAGSTTTTWGTPYPSYLKVGSLSAISADLGTITAGSINTSGYVRAEGNQGISLPDPSSLSSASRTVALAGNVSGGQQVGAVGYSATGGMPGVYGYNSNSASNGIGVFGYGKPGVLGKPLTGTNGAGVQGEASATSGSAGVLGFGGGSGTYGVKGATPAAGGGVAVIADATSGGTALQVIGASTFSGQVASTLSTGTAPFSIASTTEVANLNAALLKGKTWATPDPIGSTTPSSAVLTTLQINQGSSSGTAAWNLPNGGSTASGKPGTGSTGVFVPLNMNGVAGWILWWPN